eukprot:TRINITY_DN3919_c0_g1_i1.p1 TRINITY_DN3919_c0_g1~~TRINITY_DN3919_c0_g1_i1.p1  ORF type:complete len:483 (+),score=199.97 TRINITY_DN3919_c0_g1_i1:128-1576(+)
MSKVPDTKKPADTPFKQQRLWAWQPILSPAWVITCFLLIAGAFIPIGAMIIASSEDVKELTIQYDDDFKDCPWWNTGANGGEKCLEQCANLPCPTDLGTENCGMVGALTDKCPRKFDKDSKFTVQQMEDMKQCDPKCRKTISVEVTETMDPPIYMYYKLTDFYQNHRRYAKSRADEQLSGGSSSADECSPVETVGELAKNSYCESEFGSKCGDIPIIKCDKVALAPNEQKAFTDADGKCVAEGQQVRKIGDVIYSPCGLIAWSKFNDTFTLVGPDDQVICNGEKPADTAGTCSFDKIAWDADVEEKYKKPTKADNILTYEGMVSAMSKCNESASDDASNANECNVWAKKEHLQILPYLYHGWYMFEPYHKLSDPTDKDFIVWMRTASLPTFRKLHRKITEPLKPGTYSLTVDHRFDVSGFGGKKFVVFSTLTWIGGKNVFLGITYIAVGCLCFLFGFLFAVKHCCFKGNRGQEVIQQYQSQR